MHQIIMGAREKSRKESQMQGLSELAVSASEHHHFQFFTTSPSLGHSGVDGGVGWEGASC